MKRRIDRRSSKNVPLRAIISVGDKMCAQLQQSGGNELAALWIHALTEFQDEGKATASNAVLDEKHVRTVNDKFN